MEKKKEKKIILKFDFETASWRRAETDISQP